MHMPRILAQVLGSVGIPFHTWGDMQLLRDQATVKKKWDEITDKICRLQLDKAEVAERHRLEKLAGHRRSLSHGDDGTKEQPPRRRQRWSRTTRASTGAARSYHPPATVATVACRTTTAGIAATGCTAAASAAAPAPAPTTGGSTVR